MTYLILEIFEASKLTIKQMSNTKGGRTSTRGAYTSTCAGDTDCSGRRDCDSSSQELQIL